MKNKGLLHFGVGEKCNPGRNNKQVEVITNKKGLLWEKTPVE